MVRDLAVLDILQSPALPLLLELQASGLAVVVTASGTLRVGPRDRLTAAQLTAIETHKDALKALALVCEDGVQARRSAFIDQLAQLESALVPALMYRLDVPYRPGYCFSCGDPNGRVTFGRCWRCALGWRLAVRAPVSADIATVYDDARSA